MADNDITIFGHVQNEKLIDAVVVSANSVFRKQKEEKIYEQRVQISRIGSTDTVDEVIFVENGGKF